MIHCEAIKGTILSHFKIICTTAHNHFHFSLSNSPLPYCSLNNMKENDAQEEKPPYCPVHESAWQDIILTELGRGEIQLLANFQQPIFLRNI